MQFNTYLKINQIKTKKCYLTLNCSTQTFGTIIGDSKVANKFRFLQSPTPSDTHRKTS